MLVKEFIFDKVVACSSYNFTKKAHFFTDFFKEFAKIVERCIKQTSLRQFSILKAHR